MKTSLNAALASRRPTRSGCALLMGCLIWAGLAQADERPFPPDSLIAKLQPPVGSEVVLSGKPYRLAPGAQIRDADNLIVMPASLVTGGSVRFVLDGNGEVARVWFLTPAETAVAGAR